MRGCTPFQDSKPIQLIVKQLLPFKAERTPRQKTPVSFDLLKLVSTYLESQLPRDPIESFLITRDLVFVNMSFFGLLRRSDANVITIKDI
jgi:hypothetical protein